MLAVFTVDNLDDFAVSNPGDAPGTLRQAIFDANDTPGFDTIEFDIELPGTVYLSEGQLQITDPISILGDRITIDAQNASRIFDVNDFDDDNLLNVSITELTLTGGNDPNGGGAIFSQEQLEVTYCFITGNTAQWGGGIYIADHGNLTVSNCEVSGNTATSSGGGIYNWGGNATITDSGIVNNETSTTAGGVLNANNGSMTITRSTISGNRAVTTGGGLHNGDGNITIADSTISGNEADYGGGVYVVTPSDDTTTISGSTISNNIANLGGAGVYKENGHVVIEYSTITENNSNDFAGSGIVSRGDTIVVTEIKSSIIAGNHHTDMAVNGFPNSIVSNGYNLVGVFGYTGDLDPTDIVIGSNDPLLGPLTINGGSTRTHDPLLGSPAMDAGDPLAEAGVNGVTDFDQRGFERIFDGDNDTVATIDIGAVESDNVYFVVDTLADESDGDLSAGDFSLREAIEQAALLAEGSPVVQFDPTLFAGGPESIFLDVLLGQLEIMASMDIEGPGADLLTIVAAPFRRIFVVDDFDNDVQSDVAIRALTLTGGNDPNGGGAIFSRENLEVANSLITGNTAQWGGGIYNDSVGYLTVINSEISGNDATASGGGVYNWGGSVDILDSLVSGNESANEGGGIKNVNNGRMIIFKSTISGNTALSTGGGLYNGDGNVFIHSSTFSGNTADKGGGIYVLAPTNDITTIKNSTISNNIAPLGGAGVFTFSGQTVIQFSTITENNSNDFAGSGVVTWGEPSFALTEIYSTIVAGNHHTDVAVTGGFIDTFESLGYNVIGTGSVDPFDDPGDWVIGTDDPGIGPLAHNGGPTMTHALLPGSPAIDQGDSSLLLGGLVPFFDQRGIGFDRIRDGNGDSSAVIDVGAFELEDIPDSADFDQDGDVDGRDFLAWQRGFGTTSAVKSDGDADNDGSVDGIDLGIWQEQYSTTPELTAVSSRLSAGDVIAAESVISTQEKIRDSRQFASDLPFSLSTSLAVSRRETATDDHAVFEEQYVEHVDRAFDDWRPIESTRFHSSDIATRRKALSQYGQDSTREYNQEHDSDSCHFRRQSVHPAAARLIA